MNPSAPRLDHIGIAVADATETAAVIEKVLGAAVYKVERVAAEHVETHFIATDRAKLELVAATSEQSAIHRYLQKHREGLHHLAFEVDDIDAAWLRAERNGLDPLGDGPKAGADGKHIFFLHPRATGGILIEFCAQTRFALDREDLRLGGVSATLYRAGGDEEEPILILGDMNTPAEETLALAQAMAPYGRVGALVSSAPAPADAVPRILERFAARRAYVVGIGTGGHAGLTAAASHPDRCRGLVAAAPALPEASSSWPAASSVPLLIAARDAGAPFDAEAAVALRQRYPEARLAISPEGVGDTTAFGEACRRFFAACRHRG